MFRRWVKSTTTLEEGKRSCFGKSSYKTLKIADQYATKAENRSGIPLYVYSCTICKEFHLSKKIGPHTVDRKDVTLLTYKLVKDKYEVLKIRSEFNHETRKAERVERRYFIKNKETGKQIGPFWSRERVEEELEKLQKEFITIGAQL